jgi:hypothetical protein
MGKAVFGRLTVCFRSTFGESIFGVNYYGTSVPKTGDGHGSCPSPKPFAASAAAAHTESVRYGKSDFNAGKTWLTLVVLFVWQLKQLVPN